VTTVWGALIVTGVAALAIGAMLLVRRGAPEGSYFQDGDRAAGVFGVLATGFAVLVGFVIFLAFDSYDTARSGAETEARIVTQQFETAQFLPTDVRRQLSGELVCYARSVAHGEWPRMASSTLGDEINPWGAAMFRTMQAVEPKLASEQTAYDTWFAQRSDRETGRADRMHGAEGVIPRPLWIVLFLSATLIFVFMLFFADSAERALVQATMMGAVATVVSSSMLLLWFLDHPFHEGLGQLQPVAMERALVQLGDAADLIGLRLAPPCDAAGTPRS
jgi:hypothetical protein